MPKKTTIHTRVLQSMGKDWVINIKQEPFTKGKSAKMPSLGYPCAVCANKSTQLCFAESTEEVHSRLLWMELYCRSCNYYTLYTTKK